MTFDIIAIEKEIEVTSKFYESDPGEYRIEYLHKRNERSMTFDELDLCVAMRQYGLIKSFTTDFDGDFSVTYEQLDAPDATILLDEFITRVFSDLDAKSFLISYYLEQQMQEWARGLIGDYRKGNAIPDDQKEAMMKMTKQYNLHVDPTIAMALNPFTKVPLTR